MHLLVSDGSRHDFTLSHGPFQEIVTRWIKHLRHVELPWRPWDWSDYRHLIDFQWIIGSLASIGQNLNIEIDCRRCYQQDYLNELHMHYESNYNGQSLWLDFHEMIHLMESKIKDHAWPIISLNWREKAGPLAVPFDYQWLSYGTNTLHKGMIFLAWDELGKNPKQFYLDGENLTRLPRLAKPWLNLKPKFFLATKDYTPTLPAGFDSWWAKHQESWCKYYDIPEWTVEHIDMVLPIGWYHKPDILVDKLTEGASIKGLMI